jgi:hypothetical protein
MADRKAYDIYQPIVTNGHARALHALGGSVSILAADLGLNDTVGLFKVPAGFTVLWSSGDVTDLDTNGAPALTFTIGDADGTDDFDRLLTTSTAGQAGGVLAALPAAGVGYTYTADTEIVLTVTAAAATAAAGTLTFWLFGYFDKG